MLCSCPPENLCSDCRKMYPGLAEQNDRNARETVGIVGDAMLAGASLVGLATNPPDPRDIDQLADAYFSQVESYRQSIEEATRDQGRPSSQQ